MTLHTKPTSANKADQHPTLTGWFTRLHNNDRGNLGILLLLTVWALTSLIGMVWNTGEYATRRRNVQTAADAAAHAGNLWISRTTNVTTAANLVIAENGSAEAILRSVQPTHDTIQQRFDSEGKRARQLQHGDTPNQPEQGIPDCEYFEELLGFGAWAGNGRGDKRVGDFGSLSPDVLQAVKWVLPFLDAPTQARLNDEVVDHLRRNGVALRWLNDTWVAGNDPGVVGVPTPQGGGLRTTVGPWITDQVRPRLADILQTLQSEQSSLDQWVSQTDPAVSGHTPEELQENRSRVFEYEQQILDMAPGVVEQQRSAMATFYKCDVTFATPGTPSDEGQPASIQPPLEPATAPESKTQNDSIREHYPDATRAKFGDSSPSVTVDPINVNVGSSVIWHPGLPEKAPPGIMAAGKEFTGTFQVNGGEWGHLPCAPLSRFFNDRISRDREGLRPEPQAIDQARSDLRGRIYPPPAAPQIPTLPNQIPDEQPPKPASPSAKATVRKPIPIPPESVGTIPLPIGLTVAQQGAINALNPRIQQFNQDVGKYVSDLGGLQQAVQQMYNNLNALADSSSTRFADSTWLGNVDQNRALVLMEMGTDKEFMVLKTYKLASIPDWAKSGMHDDVHQYVMQVIYSQNIGRITNDARTQLQNFAYGPFYSSDMQSQQGNGGNGGAGRAAQQARQQAQNFANQYASQVAQSVVNQAADQIATEVADEWIARPWPFEVAPPTDPVPPTRGLTDDERQHYFSFLAGAKTTDGSGPRPTLPQVFTANSKPFAAFAQGENFNWMEFNANYGAGDSYDHLTQFGHGDMGGAPRPWRLSTIGGWNWQPRLALSDALGQAIQDGPEFRDYLNQSGVSSYDSDAIKTLSLH